MHWHCARGRAKRIVVVDIRSDALEDVRRDVSGCDAACEATFNPKVARQHCENSIRLNVASTAVNNTIAISIRVETEANHCVRFCDRVF